MRTEEHPERLSSGLRIGLVSKFGAADGLCVRAEHLLKGLIERDHEVHVFTQADSIEYIPESQFHKMSAVPLNPHLWLDSPSAMKMIARVCKKQKLDLLHVQMNSGLMELMLPLIKDSLPPLLSTFHLAYAEGNLATQLGFGFAWRASMFALRKYDHIILVDPMQRRRFLAYGIDQDMLTTVPNGVDTDLFTPCSDDERDEIVDFVYVGRLSVDKGVHILLDAFREFHRENPSTRLTLVGDGLLKGQLDDTDTNGSIRWLGALQHKRVPSVLKKADIFVIPQNIGGLGLSVIEAMSCGLPVITTSIGETTRLLESREGILVKPENKDAVIDAMRLLASDENLRSEMGNRCREKIVKNYSWSNRITQIEAVYEKMVS
jgi:glycosyltransferase involved in cell wall biosynthesis